MRVESDHREERLLEEPVDEVSLDEQLRGSWSPNAPVAERW